MPLLGRLSRSVPIFVFLGVLFLPMMTALTGFPRIPPLQEYRPLAKWPTAGAASLFDGAEFLGFTKQLDAWCSDHFPTRAFWVRLHTQLLYSLFGHSSQVHVGRQNWLFYRSVIDRETPSLDRVTDAGRAQMTERFAKLTRLLAERDIRLFVMPLTLKHRFYPEYLPASANHAKRFRFYDQFLDGLAADGRTRVIDVRRHLEEAKRAGLKLYHQTDFHWTDPAGAAAFRVLLDELGKLEGKQELVRSWSHEITTETDFVGGQGRALPLFCPPTETTVGLKVIHPRTEFDYTNNDNGIELSGVARPGQASLLSPILVYGDSFFDAGTRAGFFNLFSAFARARVWTNDLTVAYSHRPAGTRYMVIEYITSAAFGIDNYVAALIKNLEDNPAL
jgi:hypothetical protein